MMRWKTEKDEIRQRQFAGSSSSQWNTDEYAEEFNVPDSQLADVDSFKQARGISVSADVCGGVPCMSGTRIPVWVLEQCRRLGMSDKEILEDYPVLSKADLKAAWEYVESNRDAIDGQIRENAG